MLYIIGPLIIRVSTWHDVCDGFQVERSNGIRCRFLQQNHHLFGFGRSHHLRQCQQFAHRDFVPPTKAIIGRFTRCRRRSNTSVCSMESSFLDAASQDVLDNCLVVPALGKGYRRIGFGYFPGLFRSHQNDHLRRQIILHEQLWIGL